MVWGLGLSAFTTAAQVQFLFWEFKLLQTVRVGEGVCCEDVTSRGLVTVPGTDAAPGDTV